MKNFKKVLALVLVLATLLGLATMASATEYKDADKIAADYDEAVKVLDLIETMQGYPNGEFRPTANITREEAAKLIAIFDNKDADISTYYTSINPFADEKGRWGESYVGYGYRAGIIAGMNANTFAPTANVTGTQFLKMALVTLGYDQEAEGFVGSSWAVNVLALARKLDLIDGLADGWKPEADLTRQEAAQILLNTLKADTVEYAQEAKSANWKPTENKDGVWTFGGKLYLTVAGAVKTGNKLYKDFKLAKDVSEDAFMRPYTKWVYDKDDDKTVEVMDSPKATFTTKFNACELLVALGVKENDTKTKKVIAEYYINGALVSEDEITLQHTASKCKLKTDEYEKYGAQGTLTQVFKMKNDKDETVYRICSIDTWLGKLAKVTKTTTSHDNHKKGEDLVQIVPFTVSNDGLDTKHNYHEYCTNSANYEDCGKFEFAGDTSNNEGYIAYDKPAGLAKDDYVLFTYSFKQDDNEDMGVQSVDVVTAKEGRLNGFKYADVADDPSETRIGGEYVKDAAHFHLGYDESKDTANFGTRGFFYDAYGNVIGMKDAADTSKYGVLDKVWVEYNKGVASIHANIVGLDAKVTEDVVVATIKYGDDKAVEVKPTTPDEIANKYELAVKDILSAITYISEQNYKAYYFVYDLLGKFETNTKGEYTLSRADDDYAYDDDANVTFVKGKPVLKIEGEDSIKVTANTEFLVRTDDVGTGSYVSWKGYTGSDVKSVVAHGYDIVKSDDGEYAEVVYLYDIVGFNDGKFVAYVPANARMWQVETSDDGDIYFVLEAYVNGVKTELYISDDDAKAVETNKGSFMEFRYREIGEVNTAKLNKDADFNLKNSYTVDTYKDGVLELTDAYDNGETIIALAKDCVIYFIRKDGDKVVKEDKGLEYAADYIDAGDTVYMDWNDKNDDGEDQVFALYVVEKDDD
jgi:hypothetical protein